MHDFGIFEWSIGLLILTVLLVIFWRRKHNPWYLLVFSFFWLYLMMLVSAVLFPIPLEREFILQGRLDATYILSQVNLTPFKYLILFDGAPTAIFYEIMDNILLTIPFGFGLSFLIHIKARDFFWLAFALGFGIETVQFGMSLFVGPYRTVDVTDVILNALGVLLGYALFHLFAWFWRCGLGAFVDEVALRNL